jgi:putative transposase
MNPVRAGMVVHPAEYPWTSYRANGQDAQHDWLTPHAEYLALGKHLEARLANYRGLFGDGMAPGLIDEIRTATNGNYALGNERFTKEVSRMLQQRVTPGKPGRPAKSD